MIIDTETNCVKQFYRYSLREEAQEIFFTATKCAERS